MAEMTSYHVKVAAEAFAAGMFAHAGYDVSVQYGADQPEYDLIVAKDDKLMKVSVKGSQTGAWGLTQSYLRGANYHEAIGKWRAKHGPRTAFCLVQFKDVALGSCPRAYLATVEEIARQLNKTSRGRGETMLYEDHTWGPRASAAGVRDRLPDEWRFSSARVEHLIRQTSG